MSPPQVAQVSESMSSRRGHVREHGIYAFWSRPKHTQHHIDYQNYTRQQTTTNDYCRLQTFVQRVGLDRWFFFAAEILNNIAMETPEFISGIPTD